jgi:hypothetical protein
MPDGFALAALSFALRFRVEQMIREYDSTVTGQFDIVSRAPEVLGAAKPASATLTLYPWRLVPNPGWQSSRASAYSSAGERHADPWLALDVSYVLAGYAPDSVDAEPVLGLALLAMHETPVLTPELLEAAAAGGSFPPSSPLPQALRDLAAQPAPLKVSPMPMDLETTAHVWSALNSGARSGMTYMVSTLLIERRLRRAPAPGVREARLGVVQIRRPTIARLVFAATPTDAFTERQLVEPGEAFQAHGSGLRADITQFIVSNRTLTADPALVRTDRVEGVLPADLRAGLSSFQIVHRLNKPEGKLDPPAAGDVPGERSNLVPIAIRPMLDDPAVTLAGRTVDDGIVSFTATAHFTVAVGNRQRAELLLNALTADGDGNFRSYVFVSPDPPVGTADSDTPTRDFAISDVLPGNYLVRVAIDGAESALTAGAGGYDGPVLAVPA